MIFSKLIRICWIIFASTVLFITLHIAGVYYNFLNFSGQMPSLEILENPKSELASELLSSDQIVLGKYFRENRSHVEYDEISPNLIKALLATEDIRFEDHPGIDLKGILAISWYLLRGENRGSSTISQQLAKNLFRTREEKYEGIFSQNKTLNKIIVKTR